MKMTRFAMLGLAFMLCCSIEGAQAADFGGAGDHPSPYCYTMRRSPILDLSSQDAMEREVQDRFAHALDVSTQDSTISSRSPRFPWASEAKVACGMAIGYFRAREINEEMISKCDCYYGRMLRFTY
jgi:hypothetical protein